MYALVECKKLNQKICNIKSNIGVMGIGNANFRQLNKDGDIKYIEQAFSIRLKSQIKEKDVVIPSDMMVAYIGYGEKVDNDRSYYDLDTHQLMIQDDFPSYIVSVSTKKEIDSIDYITCVVDLVCRALQEGKRLIIYADIDIVNKKYRYRSLMNKVLNDLLKSINGVLVQRVSEEIGSYYIPTANRFESYIEYTIYTRDSFSKAINKIISLAKVGCQIESLKREYRGLAYRQENSLYKSIFYKQIPDNQIIYVPIQPSSVISEDEYRNMGLDYIRIGREYSILMGLKENFDRYSNLLQNNVLPTYNIQILTPPPLDRGPIDREYSTPKKKKQSYYGEGVYIGVIGVEGIDYTNPQLMTPEGKSRIAYVWEQKEGNKGEIYSRKDIDEALLKNKRLSIYPTEKEDLTAILSIAGRSILSPYDEAKGLASQSEFVVAKIEKAPEVLQKIYGGMPNTQAVVLEDIFIAIDKLVTFANKMGKPLVLCLTHGSNISCHDGKKMLERLIGLYASQPGISIVTMSGEEADKGHHTRLHAGDEKTQKICIDIKEPHQKIVGVLCANPMQELNIELKVPYKTQGVSLIKQSEFIVGECKIITSGETINYDNGFKYILFSLENMEVGEVEITVNTKSQENITSIVDVWITQEALNRGATLTPSEAFVTITSIGNISNLICVGGYDCSTLTVQKGSGRGYTEDDDIKPTLVTQAKDLLVVNSKKEWELVSGSSAAMANVAGVLALIYSKLLKEGKELLPNTLVMGTILVSSLERLATVEYPNRSQGYGVFSANSFDYLFSEENKAYIWEVVNGGV